MAPYGAVWQTTLMLHVEQESLLALPSGSYLTSAPSKQTPHFSHVARPVIYLVGRYLMVLEATEF